jgi:drug/metabolite transporter (DMT)-like permease
MPLLDVLFLLALAAIWGGSFIFMRYLAPILGPVTTTGMRLLIAGLFLLAVFTATGFRLEWRRNWKRFLVLGIINSGAPFLLYSFAALHIPASLSVILNSLAPLFGAVFSALSRLERLTLRKAAGLVLGIAGVALVSSLGPVSRSPWALAGVGACVLATVCYALAGVYIRKRALDVKPRALAGGSQLMAGVLFVPLILASPPRGELTLQVGAVTVVFAVLCSAVAFLLYYRLVADVGATRALTVTLLMPAFGMLWGFLFLGERISWMMILGALVILAGTFLVVFPPRNLRRAPEAAPQ